MKDMDTTVEERAEWLALFTRAIEQGLNYSLPKYDAVRLLCDFIRLQAALDALPPKEQE